MDNNVSREFVLKNLADFAFNEVDDSTAELMKVGLEAHPDLQAELRLLQELGKNRAKERDLYSQMMARRAVNIQPKVMNRTASSASSMTWLMPTFIATTIVVVAGIVGMFTASEESIPSFAESQEHQEIISEAELLAILDASELTAVVIEESDVTGEIATPVLSDEVSEDLGTDYLDANEVEFVSSAIFDDQIQIEEVFASMYEEQEVNELIALMEQEL